MTDALQPLGDYAIEAHAHLGFIAAHIGDTTTASPWTAGSPTCDPYLLGQNTELRGALHALLGRRNEAVRLPHQAVGEGRFFDVGKHVYFEYEDCEATHRSRSGSRRRSSARKPPSSAVDIASGLRDTADSGSAGRLAPGKHSAPERARLCSLWIPTNLPSTDATGGKR